LKLVVSISDYKTSSSSEDEIITHSLGSCIGLTLYDPVAVIGGLIHCMLPLSKNNKAKADANPSMFVDTGVPLLLQVLFDMGAKRQRLIAKVAGGSNILDEKGMFKIGERNYLVLRKILWKNNILIDSEEVGGSQARTMILRMNEGKTFIKSAGQEHEL